MSHASITEKVRQVVEAAIRHHPKAGLYARVNCEDNFAAAMFTTGYDAAMDYICAHLNDNDIINWFNVMCKAEKRTGDILSQRHAPPHKNDFDTLVLTTCKQTYKLLA